MAGEAQSELNRIQDHCLPRDWMQHLGMLGIHPFSQARSHDNSCKTWHGPGRLSRLMIPGGILGL
jgi:hypothetical protein